MNSLSAGPRTDSDFPRLHATRIFAPRAALVHRIDDAHERGSQLYSLVRQVPAAAPHFAALGAML